MGRQAKLSAACFYEPNLNPPALPTYNSGLGTALDKSLPLEPPPLLELPTLVALPSKPLSSCTCGGVAAPASLPSPKFLAHTTSV